MMYLNSQYLKYRKNYNCRPFSAKENSQLDNYHDYPSTIYRQIDLVCMQSLRQHELVVVAILQRFGCHPLVSSLARAHKQRIHKIDCLFIFIDVIVIIYL